MLQPKFILTNRCYLRMGMVELHKQLLHPDEECWGGGYYEFDNAGHRLLLSGHSYDFGKPLWDWCPTLQVPAHCHGWEIVYLPHTVDEEEFVVSQAIAIEYYE